MILLAKHLRAYIINTDYRNAINDFERFFPDGLDLDKFEIRVYDGCYDYFKLLCGTINEFKNYLCTFDSRGNILEIKREKGIITFQYDNLDRVIKMKIPYSNGHTIFEWEYDQFGEKCREKLDGSQCYHFSYEFQNNQLKKMLLDGKPTIEVIKTY
jgi:hypothetical protein